MRERPRDRPVPAAPEDVVRALALEAALELAGDRLDRHRPEDDRTARHPGGDALVDLAAAVRTLPARDPRRAPPGPPDRGSAPPGSPPAGPGRHPRPAPGPWATRGGPVSIAVAAAAVLLVGLELAAGPAGGRPDPLTAPAPSGRLVVGGGRVELTSLRLPAAPLAAIACPGAGRCVAVANAPRGSALVGTPDGGARWPLATSAAGRLVDVQCASPLRCWAVGSERGVAVVLATSDGGRSWGRQAVPDGVSSLRSISCPSAAGCWAVGSSGTRGVVVTSTDSGGRWAVQATTAGAAALGAVACPVVTTCVAAGRSSTGAVVLSTTDGGGRWAAATLAGTARISTVACATDLRCWAAGTDGGGIRLLSGHLGDLTTSAVTAPALLGHPGSVSLASCRPACGPMADGAAEGVAPGPDRVLTVLEGRPDATGRRAATTALACPTARQCWLLASATGDGGTGFEATLVGAGPPAAAPVSAPA